MLETRKLDFFYGKTQALYGVDLPVARNKHHRADRPVGLRQVHPAARAEPHLRPLSGPARRPGEILLDGENILRARERRPGADCCARARRHGVPEADAVPDVDLRQRRLRRAPLREACPRPTWTRSVEELAAPRRAVGRGEGQAAHLGPRPLRRPAAAAVRRPRHRRASPRSCCSTSRPRRSIRSPPPSSKRR